MSRQLREPNDADGLVFLHNLQQGNVAAEQIQVLAYPVGQCAPTDHRLAAAAHRAQEKDPLVNVDQYALGARVSTPRVFAPMVVIEPGDRLAFDHIGEGTLRLRKSEA